MVSEADPQSPFPDDAFAGTAAAYAAWRPPYPAALVENLMVRTGAPRGRLLDLACGPGRLALQLAPRFAEVWGIDLEPEMIEVARSEMRRRGVSNARWLTGRAEALEAPDGCFDLITIGEAFHRLDQPHIVARASLWLRPGGVLAILGHRGPLTGPEPWQRIVAETAARWRERVGAVDPPSPPGGPTAVEQILRGAGFEAVGSFDFMAPRRWTLDEIRGYLRSTSYVSQRVLGEAADAFEADLTAALVAYDVAGAYDEIERFGYTFARRPQA